MKIQNLTHGLFFFRNRLFLKFKPHSARAFESSYGIFALELLFAGNKMTVKKAVKSANFFKGDIQPAHINSEAKGYENLPSTEGSRLFLWPKSDFHTIEDHTFFIPYDRDIRETNKNNGFFIKDPCLHVRWDHIRDGKPVCHAIDLVNATFTMHQQINFGWNGHMWHWPVIKITDVEFSIKEEKTEPAETTSLR